jgi:hypothetical protein
LNYSRNRLIKSVPGVDGLLQPADHLDATAQPVDPDLPEEDEANASGMRAMD